MTREDFYFLSNDNKTKIHAVKYTPYGEIKGVFQICHGMVEMIQRYDDFARFMAENGYVVVGNDHLGHGQSVRSKHDLGYFCKDNGNEVVVNDMQTLRLKIQEEYKDLPYFILGHSMGSFLTRMFLTKYSEGISGAIIMGTGYKPSVVTKSGMALCKVLASFKSWRYRSDFIDSMGMGGYNVKFGEKGGKDWLSRNKENVSNNLADPLCNFRFTLNGYYNLFKTLNYVCKEKNINKTRKDLPIFFVSGEDDPVGDYSEAVIKVFDIYKSLGFKDVRIKLYKDDRHEILNEVDNDLVYNDIYNFCEEVR